MKVYHCTTPHKLERYKGSNCIYSPVRGFTFLNSAKQWCKKTGRSIILEIETKDAYPLPDHWEYGKGIAVWIDDNVRNYKIIKEIK